MLKNLNPNSKVKKQAQIKMTASRKSKKQRSVRKSQANSHQKRGESTTLTTRKLCWKFSLSCLNTSSSCSKTRNKFGFMPVCIWYSLPITPGPSPACERKSCTSPNSSRRQNNLLKNKVAISVIKNHTSLPQAQPWQKLRVRARRDKITMDKWHTRLKKSAWNSLSWGTIFKCGSTERIVLKWHSSCTTSHRSITT